MGQLGLHLRLNDAELAALEALGSREAICEEITENLEEAKFEAGEVAETDKSWAYIHAGLMGADPDGPLERQPTPLPSQRGGFFARLFANATSSKASWKDTGFAKYAIVGVEDLAHDGEAFVGLTRKSEVPKLVAALKAITSEELMRLVEEAHGVFDADGDAEEAAQYAASWFDSLVEFYKAAAEHEQHVIFSVNF